MVHSTAATALLLLSSAALFASAAPASPPRTRVARPNMPLVVPDHHEHQTLFAAKPRLGYTSKADKTIIKRSIPLPAKKGKRQYDSTIDVHEVIHDPSVAGAWEGPVWRSIYFDPSHSPYWNFMAGYTNVNGPGPFAWEGPWKRHESSEADEGRPHTWRSRSRRSSKHSGDRRHQRTPKVVDPHAADRPLKPLKGAAASAPVPTSVDVKLDTTGSSHKARAFGLARKREGLSSLAATGTPGFVEIASPFGTTNLAKSVAGLVYSIDPQDNKTMILRTSPTESTQMYLVPAAFDDASNSTLANDDSLDIVQLLVPMVDSQTLVNKEYCATFSVTPPSAMTLSECNRNKEGTSQLFNYDNSTGQLAPYYVSSFAAQLAVSTNSTNVTTAGNSTMLSHQLKTVAAPPADNSTALNSTMLLSNSTGLANSSLPLNSTSSSSTADNSTNGTSSPSEAGPAIQLFWIPASAYYAAEAPAASASATSTSSDMAPSAALSSLPTPSAVLNQAADSNSTFIAESQGGDDFAASMSMSSSSGAAPSSSVMSGSMSSLPTPLPTPLMSSTSSLASSSATTMSVSASSSSPAPSMTSSS